MRKNSKKWPWIALLATLSFFGFGWLIAGLIMIFLCWEMLFAILMIICGILYIILVILLSFPTHKKETSKERKTKKSIGFKHSHYFNFFIIILYGFTIFVAILILFYLSFQDIFLIFFVPFFLSICSTALLFYAYHKEAKDRLQEAKMISDLTNIKDE